ncbi:MAG TPA: hypothetical protein VMF90_04525 [Rhizobiaceae bacterium]|nr:hypothetical protein [Rhizobiaceae bacterium]
MSEATEKAAPGPRKLADTIREVKNAVADRDDVVVELREAQKTRIELMAAELAPVFAEVPAELDMFDFAVSSGVQPRLWIDAISHVTMGRDRRTYRFLKDTRLGRVVLAESTEIKPVADQVARYIAERMIERERMVEGEVQPVMVKAEPEPAVTEAPERSSAWSIVLLVLAGAAFGIALSVIILWERLTQLGISF